MRNRGNAAKDLNLTKNNSYGLPSGIIGTRGVLHQFAVAGAPGATPEPTGSAGSSGPQQEARSVVPTSIPQNTPEHPCRTFPITQFWGVRRTDLSRGEQGQPGDIIAHAAPQRRPRFSDADFNPGAPETAHPPVAVTVTIAPSLPHFHRHQRTATVTTTSTIAPSRSLSPGITITLT